MTGRPELFSQEIILEDQRALLRPLQEDDFASLDSIAFEPRLWRLGMSNLEQPDDLKKYIATALAEKAQGQAYPFVIFDKSEGRIAGSTRYGNISFPHKRLEIGWTWLHPDFHGKGLNKHCKFLLLRFAFESLGFNRVELKTDVLNWQSRKAILKLGAKEEGIFRKHSITDTGRIRDSVYFSIIDEEWPILKQTVFAGF